MVRESEKLSVSGRMLVVSSVPPPRIDASTELLYNLLSQFSPCSYFILTTYRWSGSSASGLWLKGGYFLCYRSATFEGSSKRGSVFFLRSMFGQIRRNFLQFAMKPSPASRLPNIVFWIVTIFRMVQVGSRIVRERGIGRILVMSDWGPAMIASYVISKLTGIPYAVYFMDIYYGNVLHQYSPLLEALARMFEPRLFRDAPVVIFLNDATERFYRGRYGRAFRSEIIHNSMLASSYESKRTPYSPTQPYRIVFTGHVYWAQERSLMNLIRTMDELRDLPVQLDLYVPNAELKLKRSIAGRINIHLGEASAKEIANIQCSATILFLPLTWDPMYLNVIATSIPQKLSGYLASGRPILIHAPPYACVTEYAKQNGFALVVDEEDTEKLKAGVKKLMFDLDYSRRLIENAQTTFYKNHDAVTNAKKLAKILDSVEARGF